MAQPKTLFGRIEAWIVRNLYFRYNAHTPQATFSRSNENYPFPGERFPFEVDSELEKGAFHLKRFPQSHLVLSEWSCSQIQFQLLSHGKSHVLLVRQIKSGGSPIGITPRANFKLSHLQGQAYVQTKGKLILPTTAAEAVYLFSKSAVKNLEADPLEWLQNALISDRKQHILSHLKSTDFEFLKWMDCAWHTLNSLEYSANGDNSSRAYSFLLTELNEHFGRKLFNPIIAPLNSKLDTPEDKWLDRFHNPDAQGRELQDFWQRIHYPAYEMAERKNISEHPLVYICFVLLAQREQMTWTGRAFTFIKSNLAPKLQAPFEMLYTLKEHTAWYNLQTTVQYRFNTSRPPAVQELFVDSPAVTFKTVNLQNKTAMRINHGEFKLVLDKPARTEFDTKKKRLAIQPGGFYPTWDEAKFTQTNIELDGIHCRIYLAWRDFSMELNGVRFRFLRKKQRIQVTIKNRMPLSNLKVGGENVEFGNGRYQKIYLPVQTSNGHLNGILLNSWGAAPWPNQTIHPEVSGIDRYGQVISHLSCSYDSSVKIFDSQQSTYQAPAEGLISSKLYARYAKSQTIRAKLGDGPVGRLLYLKADILKHQLIMASPKNKSGLRETCFRHFRFYPMVYDLSELRKCFPVGPYLIMIVAEKFGHFSVNRDESYRVCKQEKREGSDFILVHPDALETVLKSRFSVL